MLELAFLRAIKVMIEEGCWQLVAQGYDVLEVLGDKAEEIASLFIRFSQIEEVDFFDPATQKTACPVFRG